MKKELFGEIDGREVFQYTLEKGNIKLGVLDFGGTISRLVVDGVNIVRCFATAEEYAKNDEYVCCAIGRVSNRIAGGEFSLNAAKYRLTKNEGENQLHGGSGFHKKFYNVEEIENGVKMTYVSPDGEEGYPGRLVFSVTFTLAEKAVHIEYSALSDQDTIWAPTQHFYFNMNGPVGYANSNELTIYANAYTPVDRSLIPTGSVVDVTGTPFDFRTGKRIDCELAKVGVYDHNFLLSGNRAATLVGDKSGLKMDVFTDMPAMQLYTGAGEKLDEKDKGGVALEPQFTPNAINMQGFEKPILKAKECKRHYIRLEF